MGAQFVVDEKGRKTAVFLPLEEYEKLLQIAEEFEDIRDFDDRMNNPEWESFEDVSRRLRVPD